jgi:hypothetical protein
MEAHEQAITVYVDDVFAATKPDEDGNSTIVEVRRLILSKEVAARLCQTLQEMIK